MSINGDKVVSFGRTTRWFRLSPQRVRWMTEHEIDTRIVNPYAQVLASLVGCKLQYRVTSASLSRDSWRARLDGDPIPGIVDYAHGRGLTDKACFVGVQLPQRGPQDWLAGIKGQRPPADLAAAMARPGMDARPVTQDELEWLYRRSILLGHPSPVTSGIDAPWTDDDMAEICDRSKWRKAHDSKAVLIPDRVTGRDRYVVTSVIGRCQTLHSTEPWLSRCDSLDFPVEIAATVEVLTAQKAQKQVEDAMNRHLGQRDHYAEKGRPERRSIGSGIEASLDVQEELDSGFGSELSTRVVGWFRITVSGDTEAEALDRADRVDAHYGSKVTVVQPTAQLAFAKEHIPGARLSNTAFRRRMKVTDLAAGIPQATALVGHGYGWLLGETSGKGGKHAALWEPWRAMEVRERSGLFAVVGGLGSGKSSLMGSLAYRSALAGVQTTLLDPAGPLAALCYLPEFKGRARHIDLLSAKPGILNPWRLIPDPYRPHFDSDEAFEHARELAATSRRRLALDILMEMLPRQLADGEHTRTVLGDACRAAAVQVSPSPRHVLDALRKQAADPNYQWQGSAQAVANEVGDLATLPAAQLIFESGQQLDRQEAHDHPVLTIITMQGLQVPREDSDRRDWSTDEILALPLLHLSAWLVQRSVYHGDRNTRKFLGYDEVHALSRIGSGRLLLNTSARMSRAWNARVGICSQNAADLLEANIANLVDCAFVGRTTDHQAATEALRLLGLATDAGFQADLATLSPHTRGAQGRSGSRDFVWADGEGGVERIKVDLACLPAHVRQALDTTADPTRVAVA